MSPLFIASQTLLVAVSALAFWRGAGWERWAAAVLLLNWLGTAVGPQFNRVDPPWFVISLDGLATIFFLYAALFSGRRWTLWAAAFQLLLMANHLAFVRYRALEQWGYITAYYVWADFVLLALAVGAVTRKHRANTHASPQDDSHARR